MKQMIAKELTGTPLRGEASHSLASTVPSIEPARQPIEVCLTIDTEFSIGGAFTYPRSRIPVGRPAVDCIVDGTSHGLGFVLETLRRYGVDATFFVEALQTSYFGDLPMKEVAHRIADAGQDVQLHLHPEWRSFERKDWQTTIRTQRPDGACSGRTLAEMCEIIDLGVRAFARWGIARPIALRAGSFKADRNVYAAMQAVGFSLGSNLGIAISPPEDRALSLRGGLHNIGDIIELPATTYSETLPVVGERWRIFSIAATSAWEARAILRYAYLKQISPVVVLTHPFEFIKRRDAQFRQIVPNRLTQKRLDQLCSFMAENPSCYTPTTFAGGESKWRTRQDTVNPLYAVGLSSAALRGVQNLVNDFLWQL